MRQSYETPVLVTYGRIADNTFVTPGGRMKGCKSNCHLDNFGEPSGIGS